MRPRPPTGGGWAGAYRGFDFLAPTIATTLRSDTRDLRPARTREIYDPSTNLVQHPLMSEVISRANRPHRGASCHHRNYWCIKTDLSDDGEIFVSADQLDVTSCGALIASRNQARTNVILILAPGTWSAAYVASTADGSAVAIEHWEGEVKR